MKRKEGLNNKTDIYLKMNFNNNVELISSFFRDLEIKYPKNWILIFYQKIMILGLIIMQK